jgi:dTDP-4-amino-4,6-dideoxygalactose transaminase
MSKRIPIAKPYFDEKETKAVAEVLSSGWVVQGPKVREFERLFKDFQVCKHAVATSSATTALHLALLSLYIEKDDEVIIPAFTHPATANVIMYVGARVVFVDIKLPDFNIDPFEIEKKVTKKTKAIIPVHLFGLSADMGAIMDVAQNFKLKVVEDAACAHGAEYKGKKVGTIGNCGAFSFHPRKPITTGEGGMLTTNDEKIAIRSRILRSHGENISDELRDRADELIYPDYAMLGFNYRMTDIQAAIGMEQMKKLPYILEERKSIASRYNQLLSDLEGDEYAVLPHQMDGFIHSYQSYVILMREKVKKRRDEISNELQKRGITTRKGTYHVPGTTYYRKTFDFKKGDFPNSEMADARSLALPLYAGMDEEEINYVVENLWDLIKKG